MSFGSEIDYETDILTNVEKVKKEPKKLKNIFYQNHYICKIAIINDIETFKFINFNRLNDNETYDICLYAINKNPFLFEKIIKLGKVRHLLHYEYYTLCQTAIKKNGLLIDLVDKDKIFREGNKKYQYLFELAVKQNGDAVKFYHRRRRDCDFKNDIYIASVKQNGLSLKYIDEQTEEICEFAIKQNINSYSFVKIHSEKIISLYEKLSQNKKNCI